MEERGLGLLFIQHVGITETILGKEHCLRSTKSIHTDSIVSRQPSKTFDFPCSGTIAAGVCEVCGGLVFVSKLKDRKT